MTAPPSWIDLPVFLAGALLLGFLARRWQPGLSRRAVAGHTGLVLLLCGLPLATDLGQVATDIPYQWRPWAPPGAPVTPHNPLVADVPLQMLPFRHLVRERLLDLEPPLWSSELGTGQPLLGNAQSAPFSPLHLPVLPLPPARSLTVAAAWKLLLGLLLTHALLTHLGAAPPGRALAAVAFGLGPYSVGWLYHPLGTAAAWLPGVLLGVSATARGERRGAVGLAACATGLALSGHPETLAHAALAGAVVAAWVVGHLEPGQRRAAAGRLLAAAGLAFALAAPVLLPVLEVLPSSERTAVLEQRRNTASPPPFRAVALLPLVEPVVFGAPHTHDYRGPANWLEYCTHYSGVLTLAVAVAGAVALRGRVAALLLGGLLALLVALRVEPFHAGLQLFPLLGAGAHGRLRLVWCLAVAVAAGLSLSPLLERGRGRRLLLALLLAAAGGLLLLPPASTSPLLRSWWLVALGGVVTTAAVVAVPATRRFAAPLTTAAVAADLLVLGLPFHPLVPADRQLAPTPPIERLARLTESADRPWRVLAEGWDLLPNLGALYGLWDPRGNDPMRPNRPRLLLARRVGRAPGSSHVIQGGDRWDPVVHRRLAVRWVMTPGGRRLPPPWREAFAFPGGRVWENPDALPLFFVPPMVRAVADEVEARRFAVHATTLGDQSVVTGTDLDRGWVRQRGSVPRIAPRANGFDLLVEAPSGAVVVSSVSQVPGWRIRVEEREVTPLTADWAFLAFRVPPGSHRVRIRYAPAGWRWGLVLAGSALAGLLAVAPARRRRS